MWTAISWLALGLGSLMVAGTLVNLSSHPHWLVRVWDFPRVQISGVAVVSALAYGILSFEGRPWEWAFFGAILLCLTLQVRKIFPYTPLAATQVERSRGRKQGSSFRLMIGNVLMENDRHDLLLKVIRETNPDMVLLVEVDRRWERALSPLEEEYTNWVRQPQDNYYGMVLLSRLPLIDPRVEYLVQDDVPSVHTWVELPSGERVFLNGLHPRPPVPLRDQHSTPRDAELVLVGHAIAEGEDRPTVVAGDLNDVAWSRTTELFLRLSGLLDPRAGRGFYNSFSARNPFFRYPLDHVFHSNHFRLLKLRILPSIGSDHFPMLVELSLEPAAREHQPGLERSSEDLEEGAERLRKQEEAAATGDDRPARG